MFIPIWFIGILFLLIVTFSVSKINSLRRANLEVLFWKCAFIKASDEAFNRFQELREDTESLIEDGVLNPRRTSFSLLGAKRIYEILGDKYEELVPSIEKSAEQKFTDEIDYILSQCQKFKFNWVTIADRSNFEFLRKRL